MKNKPVRGRWLAMMAAVLLMLGLPSCIGEDFDCPPGVKPNLPSNFYITLSIELPSSSSTRTETTEGGNTPTQQVGQDNENKVNSAYMYFYNKADKTLVCSFLASELKINSKEGGSNENKYTLTAKVNEKELLDLAGKELSLYVVANQYPGVVNIGNETTLQEKTFKVDEISSESFVRPFGTGIEGQYCPMSNKKEFIIDLSEIKLPTGETDDEKQTKLLTLIKRLFDGTFKDGDMEGPLWNISETSKNQIYKSAGVLELERSTARVDFKPNHSENLEKDNVYELNGAVGNVYLKLVSMQLFNISKEAYIFRHTAKGDERGADTSKIKVFGNENDSNNTELYPSGNSNQGYSWVADCDWSKKTSDGITASFFNQMTKSDGTWSFNGTDGGYITLSDLTENENLEDLKDQKDGYYPWHYVMENTLPTYKDIDLLGACTGIAFRVLVCDKDGNAIDEKKDDFRITMSDYTYQEPEWCKKNGDEPAGYYLTYRYIIEHNNSNSSNNSNNSSNIDGDSGENKGEDKIAPMKYGIVRNNIYKLKVNGFNSLPKPNEPDNFYMSIDLKVLSWAKHEIEVKW